MMLTSVHACALKSSAQLSSPAIGLNLLLS